MKKNLIKFLALLTIILLLPFNSLVSSKVQARSLLTLYSSPEQYLKAVLKELIKNNQTNNPSTPKKKPEPFISIDLPATPITLHEYSYRNEVRQTYTITDIKYEIKENSSDYTIDLYFNGKKSYDYRGNTQSSSAKIGWKLYDENNNVIKSGTCYSPSLSENETFSDAHDYIFNVNAGNYRLEILSVN